VSGAVFCSKTTAVGGNVRITTTSIIDVYHWFRMDIGEGFSRALLKELEGAKCFNPAGLLRRTESAIASPDVTVAAGAVGIIELCLCG